MKNILILISIILLVSNCKKEKTQRIISGQILNCNNGVGAPDFKNIEINLFQQKNGSNNKSKVLANTTTDSDGNFTFYYNTENTYDKLKIRTSSGFGFFILLEDIPIEDIRNLKIIRPSYNLVVSLNVTKPFTSNDTLFVSKPDSNTIFKIVGPFISGRIFKSKNVPLNGTLNYNENKQKITSGVYNSATAYDLSKFYNIEKNKFCIDTVYVNIDVK